MTSQRWLTPCCPRSCQLLQSLDGRSIILCDWDDVVASDLGMRTMTAVMHILRRSSLAMYVYSL